MQIWLEKHPDWFQTIIYTRVILLLLPTSLPVFFLFIYFILQVKPRPETSQGVRPYTKRPITLETATPRDRHLPEPEKGDKEKYRL